MDSVSLPSAQEDSLLELIVRASALYCDSPQRALCLCMGLTGGVIFPQGKGSASHTGPPPSSGVLASALWNPLGHLRASDLISRAEKMQPPHGWRERIISKVPESQTAQRGLRQGVSNPAGEASMAGTQEPTGSSLPSCAFFRSHLRCHLLQTMCCLLAKKQPSLSSSNVHTSPQHG